MGFFLYSLLGDFWKTNLKGFFNWACVEIPDFLDLESRTHVFAREGWLERNFHSVEKGISSVLFPMRPRAPRGPGYRGGRSLDICLTCHIMERAGRPEVSQGQTETGDRLVAERAGTKWKNRNILLNVTLGLTLSQNQTKLLTIHHSQWCFTFALINSSPGNKTIFDSYLYLYL